MSGTEIVPEGGGGGGAACAAGLSCAEEDSGLSNIETLDVQFASIKTKTKYLMKLFIMVCLFLRVKFQNH